MKHSFPKRGLRNGVSVARSGFFHILKGDRNKERQSDRFKLNLIKGFKYINQTFCVKQKAKFLHKEMLFSLAL